MKAQALVFLSPERRFELREYPIPEPAPGHVLLRLYRSGICGTDMHFRSGALAIGGAERVLGHEFIGKVEALGAGVAADVFGRKLSVGDTALVCVAIPCGGCANCRRGETSSCMNFSTTNRLEPARLAGGFASHQFAPASNVVRVPDGLDAAAISAFSCAGPTLMRQAEYGGGAAEGETVIVQGTGAMGLFAVAWAKAKGCRVAATGSLKNARRVELAKRLGAEEVFDYRAPAPERLAAIRGFAGGEGGGGIDLAIETSGAPASFAEALDMLRIRGRYWVPGQYSNSGGVEIEPQKITFKALRITGSGQYNLDDVRRYFDFVAEHPEPARVFPECVSTFALEDFEKAFAAVEAGETMKAAFAAL